MRILHVLTYDSGGAALAARRLHYQLLADGMKSDMLVFVSKTGSFKKMDRSRFSFFVNKLRGFFFYTRNKKKRRYLKPFDQFSFVKTGWDIVNDPLYQQADIIHLHWVSFFLDIELFFAHNKKPVIWTLHDMNPFTAGCHYAQDCEGFRSTCSNCPQVEYELRNEVERNYELKKHVYANANVKITAPSQWMLNCSQASTAFKDKKHFHVFNGLDFNTFTILDGIDIRKRLNVGTDKIFMLAVADNLDSKRKGVSLLMDALTRIPNQNIILGLIGPGNAIMADPRCLTLGTVSSEKEMAALYSSADVTIVPSLQDNLPNVILESLSCGVPVISFDSGGAREVIKNGINGCIVPLKSAESLADTIKYFFQNFKLDKEVVRATAITFDIQTVSKRYMDIYKEMTGVIPVEIPGKNHAL